MDEILIPLAKDVSGTTYEMVDRFSSYVEALSTVKDNRESFIAMAKDILKKTTKQHNDVDNLLSTLQKVTLTLVADRLKQVNMTEFTKDSLPDLSRSQKQALETKARTFDDVWIERIKHRSLQLKHKIEMHKSTLRKLITVQQLCWKATSKYEDLNKVMATSVQSRDLLQQKRWPSEADVRSRDRQIERLSSRLSITSGMITSCKSEFEKKVEYESEARHNLHQMSEDLCVLVKNRIAKRLAYAINLLRDVIEGFNDVDRYEECLRLVGEINLPNIVTSILTASSDKYICPRVNDYNEMHGFHTLPPAGRIVRGTDVIMENTKTKDRKAVTKNENEPSQPDADEEIIKTQIQHDRADARSETSQEEQDAPEDIGDQEGKTDNSDDEQETPEAPPSGVLQVRKPGVYVTVPTKVIDRAPGLLKLKKGLRIKQKVEFSDVKLCLGWCRPRILSAKVWGFCYKRHVMEAEE